MQRKKTGSSSRARRKTAGKHPPVTIVTGATRGIGLAIALRLAGEGHVLVLNYRRREPPARRALQRVRRLSPQSITVRGDLLSSAQCERLIRRVVLHFGRLDLLVNNVGPFWVHDFSRLSADGWQEILDGNLSGPAHCMRVALRQMRRQKSGQILNIGALHSDISPGGVLDAPVYYAAKAALMMLTRVLAGSEGKHGVRVNAVSPGFIETENYRGLPARLRRTWEQGIPLGHFGKPDDVAEAVAFLVSERARYISGAVLHVDGGLWL
ncbi:MAG: SDR family oxidoreductase [Acidobacteriota bacterium]